MSRRLEVFLGSRMVGDLSESASGEVEFRFREEYLEWVPRPVLGQRFEDDLERVYRAKKPGRLPPFFANLVPEGKLREVLVRAANLEAEDDLELLRFVGEDLPGAVIVRPPDDLERHPAWREALRAEAEEDFSDETHPDDVEGLRFSLAGVQLKFSVLEKNEKLTLPARGETGDWIVKFPSPTFPQLPENEYVMMEWSRAAGFEVPECRLEHADRLSGRPAAFVKEGDQLLVVRRYDRTSEGRVHQEDFAQVVGFPPELKYDHVTFDSMAKLVRGILGDEALDEYVCRLVLTIAAGNNDAHLKNWSLIYRDGITPEWSPLYDQVSTVAWDSPDRRLALKLGAVKDFGRVDRKVFERFAGSAEMEFRRVWQQVDSTLEALRQGWRRIGSELPLPAEHAARLSEHWQKVPILREKGGLPSPG